MFSTRKVMLFVLSGLIQGQPLEEPGEVAEDFVLISSNSQSSPDYCLEFHLSVLSL